MTVLDPETPVRATFLERASDRLNAILVKEVRQAMRGKFFKISFWLTLTVATLVGITVCLVTVMDSGPDPVLGRSFFVAIFASLVLAAQVLVPFSTFLSMGGEFDENTWDLLTLSNLRPRQIVLGKILSGAVQALLFYSAFGPFLVFAFLLRGLDLTVLLSTLMISFVMSGLMSSFAVAMSSFGRGRFSRTIGMVLLAVILIWAGIGTVAWSAAMMFNPSQIHDPAMLEAIGGALIVGFAIAGFFFAASTARLAHPEENASTPLRVMTLLVIAAALGWASWMLRIRVSDDPMIVFSSLAIGFLFVSSIFFSTEPERLGRRVAVTLPRSRILNLLATPFLPGGARGYLFFLFGSLPICLWMIAYPSLADPSFHYRGGQLWIPFTLVGYGLVFLGFPAALGARVSRFAGWRVATRSAVIAFFILSIIVPALLGLLLHIHDWARFEHPGNVFMVVDSLWRHKMSFRGEFFFVIGAVALALGVNLPRIFRALKSQELARKQRAQRS